MKKKHDCGDGFRGSVVNTHNIVFCSFCGHEYKC